MGMRRNNRIMPYILPIVTLVTLFLTFTFTGFDLFGNDSPGSGSGITGMTATTPGTPGNPDAVEVTAGRVSAQVRVSAPTNQVIPTGSSVNIYFLGKTSEVLSIKRKAAMTIEEFLIASRKLFKKEYGELHAIDYDGPGYVGQNHTVDISEFDIDNALPTGEYLLRTEIIHQDRVIANRERSFHV